jgi:hypothetical protein
MGRRAGFELRRRVRDCRVSPSTLLEQSGGRVKDARARFHIDVFPV